MYTFCILQYKTIYLATDHSLSFFHYKPLGNRIISYHIMTKKNSLKEPKEKNCDSFEYRDGGKKVICNLLPTRWTYYSKIEKNM